jgi:hypothetical protein
MAQRPWWMTGLLGFCAIMALVYEPYDFLLKPVARDQEVWVGFMLTGWAAKATEPLHWAIYAAGAWGFWKMRPWMHPWAALYSASVALGMGIWAVRDAAEPRMRAGGLALCAAFAALSVALWRARSHFNTR